MESIIKTFTGKYVDLSKIVAISDAYFINRMGSGGYLVGFTIDCQLLEKPLLFEREFEHDDYGYKNQIKMVDGSYMESFHFVRGEGQEKIKAVARLQKEIDELVIQWRLSVN